MCDCTIAQKLNAFNSYIGGVSDRDRVMSVVQFTAMALFTPARAAGLPKLSADLKTIMELAAQYRAITRFSQWFVVGPQLTLNGIRAVIRSSPTPLIGILKTISTAFFTVFLLGEEVNLFAKAKIVSAALGKRFNRVRFVFLFWSNVARLLMNYLILKESSKPANEKDACAVKEYKRKQLSVADGVLQTLFTYGLLKNSLPAGPATLPHALKTGDICDLVAAAAPPIKVIDFTTHGLIGLIASVPGFMMSVL